MSAELMSEERTPYILFPIAASSQARLIRTIPVPAQMLSNLFHTLKITFVAKALLVISVSLQKLRMGFEPLRPLSFFVGYVARYIIPAEPKGSFRPPKVQFVQYSCYKPIKSLHTCPRSYNSLSISAASSCSFLQPYLRPFAASLWS